MLFQGNLTPSHALLRYVTLEWPVSCKFIAVLCNFDLDHFVNLISESEFWSLKDIAYSGFLEYKQYVGYMLIAKYYKHYTHIQMCDTEQEGGRNWPPQNVVTQKQK